MNEEDNKRFARYRKGFIPPPEDDINIEILKPKLGKIEEVVVKKEDLLKNVLETVIIPDAKDENVKKKTMDQIKYGKSYRKL